MEVSLHMGQWCLLNKDFKELISLADVYHMLQGFTLCPMLQIAQENVDDQLAGLCQRHVARNMGCQQR